MIRTLSLVSLTVLLSACPLATAEEGRLTCRVVNHDIVCVRVFKAPDGKTKRETSKCRTIYGGKVICDTRK